MSWVVIGLRGRRDAAEVNAALPMPGGKRRAMSLAASILKSSGVRR